MCTEASQTKTTHIKLTDMKKLITAIALLILGATQAFSYSFYLSSNQVFSDDQEAFVYFYNYTYNNNKYYSSNAQFVLYKVDDPTTFFKDQVLKNNQTQIPDEMLSTLPVVKQWEENLKYDSYYGYNSNINLGTLEEGAYICEVIVGGEIAQVPVFVSNYGIITKKVDDKILAYVTDKRTGESMPGFTAYAYINSESIEAEEYRNGIAEFNLADMNTNNYYSYTPIVASLGDKIAITQSYFYYYYYYYNNQDPSNKDYVFTDRSVYRPEQTVYFKGFFRKRDGFKYIIPQDSVVYTILDESYQEISSHKVALEEDGSFSDSLFVNSDFKLGTYYINAQLQSESNGYNYYYYYYYNNDLPSFRVEEYKKPEYEVSVELDKNQYVAGDDISASVNATYFFGSPVANADVEYRIMREVYYVPYYYYYSYWWWYQDYYTGYYNNQEVVEYGTGKINEDGTFDIDIETDGDSNGQNYRYTVLVDVRDASRRTISGSSSVIVANTEYTISAASEKYYYNSDEEIVIMASAQDYSRLPVEADLTAKIYEYNYNYGRYEYESSNVKDELTATTDPRTGATKFRFNPEKSGYYRIVIEGTDARGNTTTAETYAYMFNKSDRYYWWWNQSAGGVRIMTDKQVYNAGEQVKAMLYVPHDADIMMTVNNSSLAYYDVFKFEGETDENGEQTGSFREVTFDIGEGAFGKLEIDVAYMYNNQYYTAKEYLTVIPQDQYLNVEVIFDENTYKPGEQAYARVKVTDSDGNPVPNASVVLSTVDESLFSLYPDQTPDIRKEFYESDNTYASYTYYNYQNYYNAYCYGANISADGIAWRKNKIGDIFDRVAYVNPNEYYRLSNNYTGEVGSKITGFVIDYDSGKPISDASVKIGNKTFKTDNDGYYSLEGFELSHTTLEFSYKGHKTTLENIPLYNQYEVVLNVAVDNKNKEFQLTSNPTIVDLESQETVDVTTTDIANNVTESVSRNASGGSLASYTSVASDSYDGAAMMDYAVAEESEAMYYGDEDKDMAKSSDNRGKNEIDYKDAEVRTDFQDAIFWDPNVKTNPWGEATVRINLPDNLTTWRTTAKVITNDTKVGQTAVKITVRKDLLVRMETPRFMTVGDKMLIATNIHNYLSTDKQVKVNLAVDGIKMKGTEQIITVKANGEMRVDWPVEATWPLDATLTIQALTDEESDAMEIEVPVIPYGLEMMTAQSAYLTDNTSETMEFIIPQSVNLNTVDLEISTAPSVTAAMLSSMDDLIGYPYGCVEQTMSRFLPNVIVSNTLDNLGDDYVSTIDQGELTKMVQQGVTRLGELQHDDGGWGWWENDASHPFMTAYVANGLYLADKAGHPVEPTIYQPALAALQSQIQSGSVDDPTTNAYQMSVAMNMGFTHLWKNRDIPSASNSNPYMNALYLQAAAIVGDDEVAKEMLARLEEDIIREGTSVHWGAKKFYYSWQDDQVETTANVVKALCLYDLNNDMIPGAVQWLMNERKGQSWLNTRQTAMTIYAFNELIKAELNPDFELEVYANNQFIDRIIIDKGDVYMKGQTINLKGESFLVSLDELTFDQYAVLTNGTNKIKLVQKGDGSSYVNAKLSYFLNNKEELRKEDIDDTYFEVERIYYKLVKEFDKDGRLTYNKEEVDLNNIQSGDDILVKVKVNSKSQHQFVLIEDPIPAGCEFIRNTSGYLIPGETEYDGVNDYYGRYYYGWYNWNRWYTHREYRDSHLAMTITSLPQGTYEYSYMLKATIPGTFNVNPAVAMLMYYPEQRGFSDFGEVVIKE